MRDGGVPQVPGDDPRAAVELCRGCTHDAVAHDQLAVLPLRRRPGVAESPQLDRTAGDVGEVGAGHLALARAWRRRVDLV